MNTISKQDYIIKHTPTWQQIGQSFRDTRLIIGMSIREVAAELGTSENKISKFERGKPIRNAKLVGGCKKSCV